MKVLNRLFLAGVLMSLSVLGTAIAQESSDVQPTRKSIKQPPAIPSNDEPEKLIRYLRQQNAVLQKERDELWVQVRALQEQLEASKQGRLTPGSRVPEAVDRGMMIPIRTRAFRR